MEHSFKIFGTGYLLKTTKLNPEQLQIISDLMASKNIPLSKFFFDFDYLKKIGYQSWDEIPIETTKTIIKINSDNKMELTAQAKRIINQKTDILLDNNYLFPLYQFGESNFLQSKNTQNKIVFGEEIFGQILHCKLTTNNFNAFNLKFDLLKDPTNPNQLCFADVYYNNQKLVSKSNQFLSKSFVAFFID